MHIAIPVVHKTPIGNSVSVPEIGVLSPSCFKWRVRPFRLRACLGYRWFGRQRRRYLVVGPWQNKILILKYF